MGLRGDFKLGLLDSVGALETMETLGDEHNAFCRMYYVMDISLLRAKGRMRYVWESGLKGMGSC